MRGEILMLLQVTLVRRWWGCSVCISAAVLHNDVLVLQEGREKGSVNEGRAQVCCKHSRVVDTAKRRLLQAMHKPSARAERFSSEIRYLFQ